MGSPLMAPPAPTEIEGRRKSIKPSMAVNPKDSCFRGYDVRNSGVSVTARILVNLPTLAQVSLMPQTLGAALTMSTTKSLSISMPPETEGKL